MVFPSEDLEKCARALYEAGTEKMHSQTWPWPPGEPYQSYWREQAQIAARTLTECGWGKVPDGWKLVPLKPTGAMELAAVKDDFWDELAPITIWERMLSSSPTPPQQKEPG